MRVSRFARGTLLLTALVAFASPAHAQPSTGGSPADASNTDPPRHLADTVAEVLARHPDLARLRAAVEAARTKPAVERELMPPMVEGQAWQWPLDSWNPANVQWMVTVSQEFPGKGKRAARAARMEADAAVMANDVAAKAREIAATVVRTYVDLRVAREEIVTLDASRTLTRQIIEAAELRYAAGRSSQQDALAGVVELSRQAQEIVMARERERMARSTLNLLLGRDPDAPVGPLDAAPDEAAIPRLADLDAGLAATHPEITAIERAKDLANADLAIAGQLAKPDYVVQAGYMGMPDMTDALQFGVGVTWPSAPWVKRRVGAATAAATADIAAAEARRAAILQQLRTMAQELIVRAAGATERADALRTTVVPQTRHALEVARIAYQADRGEFMPLLDAQRGLLGAEIEIRKALGDRDRALAELRALLGELTWEGDAAASR